MWRDGKTWSQQHELTAVAIERAEVWSHVLAQVMGAKANGLPEPIAISHPDRPQAVSRKRPVTDPQAISRFFAGIGG